MGNQSTFNPPDTSKLYKIDYSINNLKKPDFLLHRVSLQPDKNHVGPEKLVMMIGTTGSGKTRLLYTQLWQYFYLNKMIKENINGEYVNKDQHKDQQQLNSNDIFDNEKLMSTYNQNQEEILNLGFFDMPGSFYQRDQYPQIQNYFKIQTVIFVLRETADYNTQDNIVLNQIYLWIRKLQSENSLRKANFYFVVNIFELNEKKEKFTGECYRQLARLASDKGMDEKVKKLKAELEDPDRDQQRDTMRLKWESKLRLKDFPNNIPRQMQIADVSIPTDPEIKKLIEKLMDQEIRQ